LARWCSLRTNSILERWCSLERHGRFPRSHSLMISFINKGSRGFHRFLLVIKVPTSNEGCTWNKRICPIWVVMIGSICVNTGLVVDCWCHLAQWCYSCDYTSHRKNILYVFSFWPTLNGEHLYFVEFVLLLLFCSRVDITICSLLNLKKTLNQFKKLKMSLMIFFCINLMLVIIMKLDISIRLILQISTIIFYQREQQTNMEGLGQNSCEEKQEKSLETP